VLCGGEKGMRETSGYGSSPNFSSVHIKCETSGYPYQVCILSKKLYLRSKVACGGGQLGGIFNLFFILLFSCFFFYFYFLETHLYGRAHCPPVQINFKPREVGTGVAPTPKSTFLPTPKNSFCSSVRMCLVWRWVGSIHDFRVGLNPVFV